MRDETRSLAGCAVAEASLKHSAHTSSPPSSVRELCREGKVLSWIFVLRQDECECASEEKSVLKGVPSIDACSERRASM